MKRNGSTVIAMRGRPLTPKRTEYGKKIRKQYESGGVQEKRANIQRLEPRTDGICNTITTVQKDNLILGKVERMEEVKEEKEEKTVEDYLYTAKDGEQYGIFKLSPRECGRLMGVTDADISKMLAVNSNSQCYKQYGNSIVVPVLCGIFSQLNIKGVTPWNKATYEQRQKWINPDGLRAERGTEQ
jgi:site-specific DNA-cytosine methylase